MISAIPKTGIKSLGTASGMLAVLFWSFTAPAVAFAVGVTPFLFIGIEHAIGFIFFLLKWSALRHNPVSELRAIPLWFYAAALIGIPGHQVTWIFALQNAPPVEATLIIYTWPLFVVIFTAISLKQKLGWNHFFGVILGLGGITLMMIGRGLDLSQFSLLPGHVIALICSLIWSVFAAVSARQPNISTNYLSVIFLISSISNLGIWYFWLDAPIPPTTSLVIVAAIAFFISSGYSLWDFGIKNGNVKLIGICSFLTPVLAAFYLVVLGKAVLTVYLLSALLLVVAGIGVAKYGEKKFRTPVTDY